MRIFCLTAALALAWTAASAAQDVQQPALSFGLGVGVANDYEGSDEFQVLPLPSFEWQTRTFGLRSSGAGLAADFLPSRMFQAGPLIRFAGGRDRDVDDAAVSALPEVDDGLEVGAYVSAGLPLSAIGPDDPAILTARLAFAQDVASGHSGFVVEGSVGVARPLAEKLRGALNLSATYASDVYMNSFFSVTGAGARASGLRRFSADEGFKDVGVSAVVSFQITDHWSLAVIGAYKRLLGDAADSPVTADAGSPNQIFGGLSIGYTVY